MRLRTRPLSRCALARTWRLHGVVAALLLFGCLFATPSISAQSIIILRDRYGVPSIQADRLEDAMYGLGYATAHDNAEQMARNFKLARGRRAEIDGASFLLTDSFLQALGLPERAETAAKTLPPAPALLLQRYCDGANRCLRERKAQLPAWIEPFTPADVLSLALLAQGAFPLQDIANELLPGSGSNQFAVAPKRTASAHAILSMDPHVLWSGPMLWYEHALYTRAFAFRGITMSGLPFGSMGHTGYVAWSMTNNNPKLYDFVTVAINPANSHQYNYYGEWRDFEDLPLTMRYRENGVLKSRQQTMRRTMWGPMVPFRNQAVRLALPDVPVMLQQWMSMATARNAKEFRKALLARGLSMWNIVYADRQGHIAYQYNAHLPRRDEALDWTRPVAGSDPRSRWGSLWSLDELPHAENPASGILVNCNSAPWLTTLGKEIPTGGWPAYVTGFGSTTRFERLSALLAADARLTPESAMRCATDTLVPYAVAVVKRAAEELPRIPTYSQAGPERPAVAAGLAVLTAWNGRADIEARGCGLYLYWMRADRRMPDLARRAAKSLPWSDEEGAAAIAALAKAVGQMRADHGGLETPWGEMHISRRGRQTEPVSGLGYFAPGSSAASVSPNSGAFRNGEIVCTQGSSFRMVVDLDPAGIRSWSCLPYGNSQDPGSPHYADQQAMFGRGVYKETQFGAERAARSAVSRTVLQTNQQPRR